MRYARAILALCLAGLATAAELELGVGLSALSLPDYRGSDEQTHYLLPIPYLRYRSEQLEISRAGLRGKLFGSERAELDLSLSFTPPSHSEDNAARQGMPKLLPTVEIGPALRYRLSKDGAATRWEAALPVRAVLALDDWRSRYIGAVINPKLSADWQAGAADARWQLAWSGGALFGSRKQHEYFYGVAPAYANAQRPAYQAHAGYAGLQTTFSASRSFGDYWLGAFVRADQLSASRFADSPLQKQKTTLSAGLALAWRFYRNDSL